MVIIERISIVLAQWCPHCVPLSLDNVKRMSKELRVPLRVLDIDDPKLEKVADELVAKYGDDCEDYIIPQVFLEYENGKVQHILTGFSEGVNVTKSKWEDFFKSDFYGNLLREQHKGTAGSCTKTRQENDNNNKKKTNGIKQKQGIGKKMSLKTTSASSDSSFKALIHSYLTFEGKCYRHCEKRTSFKDLQPKQENIPAGVLGAYTCPENYVSRVVYFSEGDPRVEWFQDFLKKQVGEDRVRTRDIRFASRYGWELGRGAFESIRGLRVGESSSQTNKVTEVYWTFYPKSEEDKRFGTFLCLDEESLGESKRGCGRLFTQGLSPTKQELCPDCRKKKTANKGMQIKQKV
jgi:thiol-disulfide isomerase/thioredoxin